MDDALFDGAALRIFEGTFPVQIGVMQIIAVATSVLAIGTVFFIMQFTAAGRYRKACSQSERLAKLSGVNTLTVLRWSCVGSAALASVSGWIIAVSYGGVTFSIGLMLGFKAMFGSVIGGFGTVSGAIIGGIFLAFLETLWTATFPLAYRDVAAFWFHYPYSHVKTGRPLQFRKKAGKRGLDERPARICYLLLSWSSLVGLQGTDTGILLEDCWRQLHVQLPLFQDDLWFCCTAAQAPCLRAVCWKRALICLILTGNL